jgi:hypothetical protein
MFLDLLHHPQARHILQPEVNQGYSGYLLLDPIQGCLSRGNSDGRIPLDLEDVGEGLSEIGVVIYDE